MKNFLLLLLALPLLLTYACNEDSFSQVVDIPIPEHEPRPALSLTLFSGDTIAYTYLTLSRGILAPEPNDPGETITELYRDDELIGTVNSRVGANRREGEIILSEPISNTPATYRLVGKVPGFDPVEAVQVMPALPEIGEVDYEEDGAIDAEGFRVDEVAFDLIDPPGVANYYAFRVSVGQFVCIFEPDTGQTCFADSTNLNSVYLSSPDPILVGGQGDDLLVTDQSFDGSSYRIRLLADNYSDGIPVLEVFQLTEDAYFFMKSYRAFQEAGDNPFAEPVQVHNNIDGGYGAFVAGSRLRQRLE